jgi:hypothetical protein
MKPETLLALCYAHQNAGTEIGFLKPDTQVSLSFSPEIGFLEILNRCSGGVSTLILGLWIE